MSWEPSRVPGEAFEAVAGEREREAGRAGWREREGGYKDLQQETEESEPRPRPPRASLWRLKTRPGQVKGYEQVNIKEKSYPKEEHRCRSICRFSDTSSVFSMFWDFICGAVIESTTQHILVQRLV